MKKYASRIYLCLVFAILYIPILTLILFSFNSSESTANFTGFSFEWYVKLFSDENAFIALRNTLILAVSSSLLSTLIGTAAAEGVEVHRASTFFVQSVLVMRTEKADIIQNNVFC